MPSYLIQFHNSSQSLFAGYVDGPIISAENDEKAVEMAREIWEWQRHCGYSTDGFRVLKIVDTYSISETKEV